MNKIITRTGMAFAAVATVVGFVATSSMAAFAVAAPDPSGGAYSTGVDAVKSNVADTYALPLFLLTAAVVGIGVGLAWLKRSKSAAAH